MKLLLDTHIWVWSQLEQKRLGRRVARALANPANEVWVSPISVWEILGLCRKGRLNLRPNAEAWIAESQTKIPFREAPVTHEVALEAERVVLPHYDPADRFLAATAKAYGLTLVTADENLLGGSGYAVLPNRQ